MNEHFFSPRNIFLPQIEKYVGLGYLANFEQFWYSRALLKFLTLIKCVGWVLPHRSIACHLNWLMSYTSSAHAYRRWKLLALYFIFTFFWKWMRISKSLKICQGPYFHIFNIGKKYFGVRETGTFFGNFFRSYFYFWEVNYFSDTPVPLEISQSQLEPLQSTFRIPLFRSILAHSNLLVKR